MVDVFGPEFDCESSPRRLEAWKDLVSRTFVSLECDTPRDVDFRGRITTRGDGPVVVSLVDTVAQSVDRTRNLIRQDDAEVVLISCQIDGEGVIAQNGRSAHLKPGDFALYDSTRPYTLHFESRFRQLVLHLPRDVLRRRLGPIRALTARHFRSDQPELSIASTYFRGLGAALSALDARAVENFGTIALDLLALGLERDLDQAGLTQPRPADALREQARQIMARRYHEPDLSTPEIARAMKISPRRLQEVFAEAATTPMEELWRRRLEASRRLLADPRQMGTSITDIAYRCGFSDSAQFSRRFRDCYHATPRQLRYRTP